jgi:ATP-dependent DNA helicase DinG
MSLESVFCQGGPLRRVFSHYEPRQAQTTMAQAVEDALEAGGVLLAEAGTGTGKTLAYLVPALLCGRTVVISTGTRNLQDQIYFKDLSQLLTALEVDASVAYLKGQENYVCRRRLAQLAHTGRALAHPAHRIEELLSWSKRTHSGDRMELPQLADDDALWQEVCSTKDTRIGAKCPFHSECFVTLARQRASRARIVVVNHHLYFADLSTRLKGGTLLPKHSAAVFDEAHLIEDIATEFFSVAVSSSKIWHLAQDALASVRCAALSIDPYENTRPKLADAVRSAAQDLFFNLGAKEAGRVDFDPTGLSREEIERYHRLDSALEALQHSLLAIEGQDEAVDHAAHRCDDLRRDLASLLGRPPKDYVPWLETRARSVVVGMSPIDVSGMLRDGVFFNLPTVVLVSATLSTAGDFTYLKSRLGLDFPTQDLSLPSPFDYSRQARLFLPTDLPDPRDSTFMDAAAHWTAQLAQLTLGGALVLCTSIRGMQGMYERLAQCAPFPLLLQGQAPKSVLIDRFMQDTTSILCATSSFWQGVDLPGHALRLVVIDKLPFAFPGDPLTSARIAALNESGRGAFHAYQLPQAALQLKQGFGRLIRTARDRGIVAILDRRLLTMSYAKLFLRSLPPCPATTDFAELKQWWLECEKSVTPQNGEPAD